MLLKDLDRVCDPLTTTETKVKLAAILRLLEGISAEEARTVLRYAGQAVDCLAVMPVIKS